MKTVDSEVCGLLKVMRTLFLGKDAPVDFLNVIFLMRREPQIKFHSPPFYWGGGRNLKDGYLKTLM